VKERLAALNKVAQSLINTTRRYMVAIEFARNVTCWAHDEHPALRELLPA
jgi:hypothetical protein